MSSRRLYDKVMTIVSTLMIFFYFGLAYILYFTSLFNHVDVAMRAIFALPLFLYGVYRIFVAYNKIKENFFEPEEEE
ncbi:MAG: hypothetical protein M0R39_13845 [Prolixibacteraceae bacterium]|nr:hypothetical protein [Prolixibacteraceae bacterium]